MNSELKQEQGATENTLKNTIYSIGVDKTPNFRELIAQVHGKDSEVVKAADELDCYVSDPETRKSPWYWNFFNKLRSGMWCLYPHSNDIVRTQMAREFMDEVINGGYIRTLYSLANESGTKNVAFAREYAGSYSAPIGAALLFGPRGGATMELLHFLAAERIHGQHRHGTSPHPLLTEETTKMWYDAQRTGNWPRVMDGKGQEVSLEVEEEQGQLPEGIVEKLQSLWRCNPALRYYWGTQRLSGDIPFQIIEDVFDILVRKKFSPLSEIEKARYNRIIEQANKQGIDPFYAVYQDLFAKKDRLRPLWNKARKLLYDYSLSLWEAKNEIWLAEGKRIPAGGVTYKPRKAKNRKKAKKKVPGTIYLNNDRFYWVVARKMPPKPLIDPRSKPKVPGTIFKDGNRYYWFIPNLLKRQRLVPKGEKFSARDRVTAQRVACEKWKRIQQDNPTLATRILRHTRSEGLSTKDRKVADKVALKMWKDIQKNDPELTAKILTDNRPQPIDHWHAQIKADGKVRLIGSYKTKSEAEAAYIREFEKAHGYPVGYNVQCIPKIDKVWPTWAEEKARLALMNEHPRMPIIGSSVGTEALAPVMTQMQRIDWLVENCIVVLDENSPIASKEMAIESRGQRWFAEIKKQGKRPVIQGSASIDKDTGRIRITIYGQGFEQKRVLIEEVYHIVFEIIRNASPKTFASIRKWYSGWLKKGFDPTWRIHEAFAELMVQEGESPESTDLPRHVVSYARKVFSPSNRVPAPIMEEVAAGV